MLDHLTVGKLDEFSLLARPPLAIPKRQEPAATGRHGVAAGREIRHLIATILIGACRSIRRLSEFRRRELELYTPQRPIAFGRHNASTNDRRAGLRDRPRIARRRLLNETCRRRKQNRSEYANG